METTAKQRIFWIARMVVTLLLIGWLVYWLETRPKPTRPLTMYLADPANSCAYPEDTVNVKKVNWRDESGSFQGWEEFPSLEAAKAAGYRLCH